MTTKKRNSEKPHAVGDTVLVKLSGGRLVEGVRGESCCGQDRWSAVADIVRSTDCAAAFVAG